MLGLPSCKEVTELASRLIDEELSWTERTKLRVHLAMCKSCQNYVNKMAMTSNTIKLWFDREPMPEELKQKLEQDFRKQNQG